MKEFIDLRSDTVTKPTSAMRKAMAEAEVGDDVFGEDPTVNALQKKVAKILGKEASIFVPSGTMGNQLAIKSHTQPGDEVIIEGTSHPYNFEGGASAALSGIQFYCLKGIRGILDASQIEEAVRPDDHHFPVTRLICLENTHNRGGGAIYPIQKIVEISRFAKSKGLFSYTWMEPGFGTPRLQQGSNPTSMLSGQTPYPSVSRRDWARRLALSSQERKRSSIESIDFAKCSGVECDKWGLLLLPGSMPWIIISNV